MFRFPLLFLALFLPACASSPDASARPAWIDNPSPGAVGYATTHVKGRHFQEELAIARARERLAAERGVAVSSVFIANQTVTNNREATTAAHTMSLEVKNVTVKAAVRAIWREPGGEGVWVWVYPAE